jgi:hypothetical protein
MPKVEPSGILFNGVDGDERPDGMQVQDGGEVIAKAHEVPEGPYDYPEFARELRTGA